MIILGIDRSQIEAGDTSDIVQALEVFSQSKEEAMKALGNVVLAVSGYDDDPRGLWTISEVRTWFARLDKEVPHMLFFLNPESKSVKFYALMTCALGSTGGVASIDPETLQQFVMQGFMGINAFCEAVGINPECPELVNLSERMVDSLV